MRAFVPIAALLASATATAAQPDLYVTWLKVADHETETWKLEAWVKNGGDGDAGPFCVFLAPIDADPEVPPQHVCLNGLVRESLTTVTFEVDPQPPLLWKAVADILDEVDESDETNNTLVQFDP